MDHTPTLYLETTVLSYLTARPSRDVVALSHQEITRQWWDQQMSHYQVFVSELVHLEAERGDQEAARRRIGIIRNFPVLEITDEVRELAELYVQEIPLSRQVAADAFHLAVATWNEIDFLMTWNCRHIASGFVKRRLAEINLEKRFPSPTICTPEELLYGSQDVD